MMNTRDKKKNDIHILYSFNCCKSEVNSTTSELVLSVLCRGAKSQFENVVEKY